MSAYLRESLPVLILVATAAALIYGGAALALYLSPGPAGAIPAHGERGTGDLLPTTTTETP